MKVIYMHYINKVSTFVLLITIFISFLGGCQRMYSAFYIIKCCKFHNVYKMMNATNEEDILMYRQIKRVYYKLYMQYLYYGFIG